MADRTRVVRADKQVLHIAAKPPPSPQPPPRVMFTRRQATAMTSALPSHLEGPSQTFCPKCRIRPKYGEPQPERAIPAIKVEEEDLDLFCDACGHELAAGRLLRQNATTNDSQSVVEFVNVHEPSGKLDEVTGAQVRAHVMRRYHETRRKSLGQHVEMARSARKDLRPARNCACPHQETCNTGALHTGLTTILGPGRSDPFLSLSMPNVPQRYHELVDYCITVLWPGFRGLDYSVAYAREWLPVASKNATVLNVFLFTASLHLETLRGPGSLTRGKIRTEQLYHKGEAIQGLNKALSDPDYCQSDEIIQNILFLAVNETGEEEEPADPSPFASPLQNVQWLGIYGTRSYAMSHVNAMQEIIRRRGGIRNIKAVGLPWLISFSELIYCATTLSKPQHPLLDPFGRDIGYQSLRVPHDAPIDRIASQGFSQGFYYLQASGMRPEVIGIFLNLKDFSEGIDAYSNSATLPDCMADNRNWVLHRLLSLPSAGAPTLLGQIDVLSEDFHNAMLCLEACRLTAIMYCVHVTFPIPRSMYARRLLLRQMKESIGKIHFAAGHQALRELLLWCIVIGGIAAYGQPERSWFAAQLFHVSKFLYIAEWSDAKGVLRKFAWLDSACNKAGTTFWNEVL